MWDVVVDLLRDSFFSETTAHRCQWDIRYKIKKTVCKTFSYHQIGDLEHIWTQIALHSLHKTFHNTGPICSPPTVVFHIPC